MFCRKCGKALLDGDRFCSYCGAQVIERRESLNINENVEEVVYNRAHFENNAPRTNWNLEGFPIQTDEPRKTEDIRVDWEKREIPKRESLLRFVEEHSHSEEKPVTPVEKQDEAEEFSASPVEEKKREESTVVVEAPIFEISKQEEKPAEKLDIFEIFDRQLEEEKKALFEDRGTMTFDRQEGKLLLAKSEKERKEAEKVAAKHAEDLEKEIFGNIQSIERSREASRSSAEEQIDKFYTFSQKNEEFQRLLDREYERLKGNIGTPIQQKAEIIPKEEKSPAKAPEEDKLIAEDRDEKTKIDELFEKVESLAEDENLLETIQAEVIAEAIETEGLLEKDDEDLKAEVALEEKQSEPVLQIPIGLTASKSVKEKTKNNTQEPKILDEEKTVEKAESIVEKIETTNEKSEKAEKAEIFESPAEKKPEKLVEVVENTALNTSKEGTKPEEDKNIAESLNEIFGEASDGQKTDNPEKKEIEKEKELPWDEEISVGEFSVEEKKTSPVAVILGIVAAIVVVEASLVGIKYFLPESNAAKFISKNLGVAVNWVEQINTEKKTPKQETEGQDMQKATEVMSVAPTTDKAILLEANAVYNENIAELTIDDTLVFDENKDYDEELINNSTPIENNIWYTDEKGNNVLYDSEIIKTIIQFDSSWIDYVNGENEATLELLKEGSLAFQNAKNYSKVGKVTKTFDSLAIGEIRQSEKGDMFFVWVKEAISTSEEGKSYTSNYKWIYMLEPIDSQLKIVRYVEF